MTLNEQAAVPVEAVLARHTAARAIYVAPPIVLVAWLAAGSPGAVAALIGVVVVVANFLLSGWMLSISARISLAVYHAAALFGFFLRLGLITLTMILVARVIDDLDRLVFGLSTVIAYLVLLTWEAVAVAKGRERNLDWIS